MSFKPIHPFVHEYDFPISDEIAKHEDAIVKQFLEEQDTTYKNNQVGYNVIYRDSTLTETIEERLDKVINDNYILSPRIKPIQMNIYVQNNERSNNLWHQHIFSSTISGVIYHNLPKDGGGFEFNYQGDLYDIKPKENKLYLFPYWLVHRPMPQQDSGYRICINIEYLCQSRPMHKHQVDWFNPGDKINIVW